MKHMYNMRIIQLNTVWNTCSDVECG